MIIRTPEIFFFILNFYSLFRSNGDGFVEEKDNELFHFWREEEILELILTFMYKKGKNDNMKELFI